MGGGGKDFKFLDDQFYWLLPSDFVHCFGSGRIASRDRGLPGCKGDGVDPDAAEKAVGARRLSQEQVQHVAHIGVVFVEI